MAVYICASFRFFPQKNLRVSNIICIFASGDYEIFVT